MKMPSKTTNEIQSLPPWFRFAAWLFFIGWWLLLIKFILFKHQTYVYVNYFRDAFPDYTLQKGWASANMVPFRNIINIIRHSELYTFRFGNITGNILGFVPAGFLCSLIFMHKRQPMQSLFLCGTASVLFEITQWFLGIGIMDVDDLVLNLMGTYLGAIMGGSCKKFFHNPRIRV